MTEENQFSPDHYFTRPNPDEYICTPKDIKYGIRIGMIREIREAMRQVILCEEEQVVRFDMKVIGEQKMEEILQSIRKKGWMADMQKDYESSNPNQYILKIRMNV